MQEKGMMLTCDRCGTKVFVNRTAYSIYGYTSCSERSLYETFDNEKTSGWTKGYNKDLCPECSAKYNQMVEDFYSGAEESIKDNYETE